MSAVSSPGAIEITPRLCNQIARSGASARPYSGFNLLDQSGRCIGPLHSVWHGLQRRSAGRKSADDASPDGPDCSLMKVDQGAAAREVVQSSQISAF